mmetsp:Transcript_59967/g.177812  ORF Transcript_59967/g.177812 Transcript_59967/m.177812 type:complete len:156 (-) Transcript_59967:394-861(-)
MKVVSATLILAAASRASAFAPSPIASTPSVRRPTDPDSTAVRANPNDGGGGSGSEGRASSSSKNPISEFFQNLDDIVDDFYNKRMGKGEIFYGKRKYRPSGTVEGDYNGMGLSDKQRIDDTREYRDEILEERRMRREMAELRRRKDQMWREEYGE